MSATQINRPTEQELFSGKPAEWTPFDIDARYLRWGSLGFSFVEKGGNAEPVLREHTLLTPNDVDKEKLWALPSSALSQ
jgi:hypothetical protein